MKKENLVAGYNILGVDYTVQVLRENKVVEEVSGHNLVLDSGMNAIATQQLANLTRHCVYGDGSAPTQRDSSTTTASQAGTTVTASAGFFDAADVGSLLKYDSGEEYYISAYTSSTEVTVDTSDTVSASEFTVWHVDDIKLQNRIAEISTFRTDGGDNTGSEAGGIITFKRTHLSGSIGSPFNLRELGWTWSSSVNPDLFNRVVLPSNVPVIAGDQLLVISNFRFSQTPRVSTAVTPPGSGDWANELDGDAIIEGYGIATIGSTGNSSQTTTPIGTTGNSVLVCEPSQTSTGGYSAFLSTNTDALLSYGTYKSVAGTNVSVALTLDSYLSNSFTRTKTAVFGITLGNFTIGSYGLGGVGSGTLPLTGTQKSGFRIKTTVPPTKANTHSLTLVFRWTWQRTLTN